ncbi:hypothetical protein [Methanosphaera cuniculi]|uniref:hypothetical protein n=1 Tax=Methanosphaera cuniculi TaxID=1077256 RepID=UPI0026DAD442|nr:hypothetical protein [Methanosphaera cuniculi]
MSKKSLGNGLEALIRVPKEDQTQIKQAEQIEEELKSESQMDKQLKTVANNFLVEDEKVIKIKREVEKNPRISLWSANSAACLRYLKKTIPEFSISREASKILDEAIKTKYPEVWALFDDEE